MMARKRNGLLRRSSRGVVSGSTTTKGKFGVKRVRKSSRMKDAWDHVRPHGGAPGTSHCVSQPRGRGGVESDVDPPVDVTELGCVEGPCDPSRVASEASCRSSEVTRLPPSHVRQPHVRYPLSVSLSLLSVCVCV